MEVLKQGAAHARYSRSSGRLRIETIWILRAYAPLQRYSRSSGRLRIETSCGYPMC